MRIEILGCSGGIGGDARTTCLRIDEDVLVDSGTGLADLSLSELARIDHIFLTHSHLDHVGCLPLLLDSVASLRKSSVTVHGRRETLDALRAHVFNGAIWPDFTQLPSPERPFVSLSPLSVGSPVRVGERQFIAIEMNHVIPAVGYLVRDSGGTLAFSGDTTSCENFWNVVNACSDLRHVIVETTFLDRDAELAKVARHLCPQLLASELAKYCGAAPVWITHLMPGMEDQIMKEIATYPLTIRPKRLARGQVLTV